MTRLGRLPLVNDFFNFSAWSSEGTSLRKHEILLFVND